MPLRFKQFRIRSRDNVEIVSSYKGCGRKNPNSRPRQSKAAGGKLELDLLILG